MEKVTPYNQSLSSMGHFQVIPLTQRTTCTRTMRWRDMESVKSYTDDETGEETEEEHHTLTDQESIENYKESEEEDRNPWEFILNEVYQKMDPIRDASVDKTMQENELPMKKHVYERNVALLIL